MGMVSEDGYRFGEFEQHTSAFGSRMLMQMGFAGEGSGLGTHAQGMPTPIAATRRARSLGLGA